MQNALDNASVACSRPSRSYAKSNKITGMGINGARVKELRTGKGWSQTKLEEVSGVSQSNISRIEQGKTLQGLADTGPALARALEVDPSSIYDDAPEPAQVQRVPSSEAAPVSGARDGFDDVAAELLAGTPEASRPAVEATLLKIQRSGSMQSLDIPLTVASLEDLVKVVSRHTRRRVR